MARLPLEHAWSNICIRSGIAESVVAMMCLICPKFEIRQKTIPGERTARVQVPRLTRATLMLPFLAILLGASAARANVTVPDVISNSMVLQRDRSVPIWGAAGAGETVVVMFASQTQSTKAGPDGKWRITLRPMTASATPGTMTISGSNTITLSDVLVGEV